VADLSVGITAIRGQDFLTGLHAGRRGPALESLGDGAERRRCSGSGQRTAPDFSTIISVVAMLVHSLNAGEFYGSSGAQEGLQFLCFKCMPA
jgi:hypothetical protein